MTPLSEIESLMYYFKPHTMRKNEQDKKINNQDIADNKRGKRKWLFAMLLFGLTIGLLIVAVLVVFG